MEATDRLSGTLANLSLKVVCVGACFALRPQDGRRRERMRMGRRKRRRRGKRRGKGEGDQHGEGERVQ